MKIALRKQQIQVLNVLADVFHCHGINAVAIAVNDDSLHYLGQLLRDHAHALKRLLFGWNLGNIQTQEHFVHGRLFQVFGQCSLGVILQAQ